MFVQWVGACRMAAGSSIGDDESEGEVGAELAPNPDELERQLEMPFLCAITQTR